MGNVQKVSGPPRKDGSRLVKWRAAGKDASGQRVSKMFDRKGDGDAWLRDIERAGVFGSTTMTVMDVAELHYRYFDGLVKAGVKEAVTRDGYQTAIETHLRPDKAFAATRLCDLTTPKVQEYLDDIFAKSSSLDLTRRQRRYLVTWCDFAIRKGVLGINHAKPTKIERDTRADEDEGGVQIPDKPILGRLLAAAAGGDHAERDTAIVRLLMFGGLRISELLGLADDRLPLSKEGGEIKVSERLCSTYGTLGAPKSKKSRRKVPIGPAAANAVRAWRLRRGPAQAILVGEGPARQRITSRLFPSPEGGLWTYHIFWRDCWMPLMDRAALVDTVPDSKGKNRRVPAFGPHTLRHVAVSLWIEQGLGPKRVQELAGHSSLAMTMDLYGHLWTDDAADAALARKSEASISVPNG